MPIYIYKHPDTGEIIEELRPMSESDKPLVLEDGTVCHRYFGGELTQDDKRRRQYRGTNGHEGFEVDPDYYKALRPKRVRFKDGHSEPYDPTKHC